MLQAELIEPVDTDMYVYHELPNVGESYAWKVFDLKKCKTLKGEYSNVWKYYNDVACVRLSDGRYNYIDRDGDFLFPMHLDSCDSHIFKEAVMDAVISGQDVRIAITGCIDMSKAALSTLMLKGD